MSDGNREVITMPIWTAILWALATVFLITVVAGLSAGNATLKQQVLSIQYEVVKRGHAEFVAKEDGPAFTWKGEK